jgi:hypothetical protein
VHWLAVGVQFVTAVVESERVKAAVDIGVTKMVNELNTHV